jgi:hypothetical protein
VSFAGRQHESLAYLWFQTERALMRKLFRFRICTLLIAMALVATLLAIGPRLWWRWKVNSVLEATVATGSDFYWEFDPLASNTVDNYAYLLSDQRES